MEILYYILLSVFVIVSFLLVLVILMQTSKTGGMGAGIGGSSAMNQAFGVEGADRLLVKITSVLAFTFMAIALSLVKISPVVSNGATLIEETSEEQIDNSSSDDDGTDGGSDTDSIDSDSDNNGADGGSDTDSIDGDSDNNGADGSSE